MFIARRFARNYAPWLIGTGIASFLLCIYATASQPTAAFYLIPFRAWELMIGSVLALNLVAPPDRRWLRESIAILGLGMMLVSIAAFTRETPFPGAAAALPTLGTALVILAGSGGASIVGRVLSIRPMVFVGLISYSLYLWHWPIVVYAKQVLINEPTDGEMAVMLLLMLVLAWLSWRFVERPFRKRDTFASRERLFAFFGIASAALLALNLAVVGLDGLPGRNTGSEFNELIVNDPGWQHWKDCEELGERDEDHPELCTIGTTDGPPRFLLWGDSHALALATAVNLSAQRKGASGLIAVRTGCPPLSGIEREGRASCTRFNDAILERIAASPELDTVIVAARWALASNGTRYKQEEGSTVELVSRSGEIEATDQQALFAYGIGRTVRALRTAGRRVVLVNQAPEVGFDVPSANYMARLTGRDVNQTIAPTRLEYRERSGNANDVLVALAAAPGVMLVDIAAALCSAPTCRVVTDGMPLYRDDNHLSLRGNIEVSPLFDPAFAPD